MTPTERQTKQNLVARIDGLIAKFNETKHQLIRELAEPDEINGKGDWYILRDKNMYYQIISILGNEVALVRHQGVVRVPLVEFNRDYVKATADDTARHLIYLKSKNIPYVEKVVERTVNLPKFDAVTINEMINKLGVNMKVDNINIHDLKRNTGFGQSMADAIEQFKANHELRKGFDTSKCEFYMITVGEEDHTKGGAKVRHTSYATAEREAIRLCEQLKKEAFIVGVVASVKPVEERKVIVTVTPKVSKR